MVNARCQVIFVFTIVKMVARAGLTPTIAVVPPTDSNLHLPCDKMVDKTGFEPIVFRIVMPSSWSSHRA